MVRLTPALLLGGCAALLGPSVAVVRWAEPPSSKRTDPTLPRRDDCLKPPYTLPVGKTLTLHGFKVEPRGEGPRELTLTSPPGAPVEPDLLLELQERNRAALHALDGLEQLGLSGCLSAGKPVPCLSLQLSLCAQPLDALTAALAEILKNDAEARVHQIVFHVALSGAAGPRCEADDARCRPDAYGSAQYRATGRRGLLAEPGSRERECSWDGECSRSACGADCVPWTVAHQPGACASEPGLSDALCGCVDYHCAWFVQ